jgi:replicative DNA helicase
MKDSRFRNNLPITVQDDVQKYLKNPACACNTPIYARILRECQDQILQYYPGREIITLEQEVEQLAKNHWKVVNCHIDDLEKELRKLPPGRKQIDVARYEDQVTVVINELDLIF